MNWIACLLAASSMFAPVQKDLTPVMVQDFEKADPAPTVWVVNIPNENASVQLSAEHPHDGAHCLKLHYQFVEQAGFQYLGIPNKIKIKAPVHTLKYWIYGNNSNCSYGVQLTDAGGETHQYSQNTGQCGNLEFTGWKQVSIDLDAHHETWGGDKNGKLDYPLTGITLTIGQPQVSGKQQASQGDIFFDSVQFFSEKSVDETLGCEISVLSPEYCSDIRGSTRIRFAASGFKTVTARCWKQGGEFGSDALVATINTDAHGAGAFTFQADSFPHGPVMITLTGQNGSVKDNCYLQLYNLGGVKWNVGLPADPPAAKGMKLLFADDFNKPLSISSTDPKSTYYDHKPINGSQDFSTLQFTSADKPNSPFKQVDSFLRIRASEPAKSSGIISSLHNDATGITATAPCYFECRFVGPNAIGTWPAFWLMTDYVSDQLKGKDGPSDELDVIEAYGGEGPSHPNAYDTFMITPHAWNQGPEGKALESKSFADMHNPCKMSRFGIPSTWYQTFHTYGCKVTLTDTIYYCDNIEVGRHATQPLSKTRPIFFMINLATGGGWPVDLSRYHGLADMYVDFVRVYKGN